MSLVNVTKTFFNTHYVESILNAATRDVLSKFGAFTRRTAKGSLRFTKSKASSPGQPPRIHRQNSPLKELIFFSYDEPSRSVIVGPMAFSSRASEVPHILEYGGRTRNKRRTRRNVGSGGEVRIGGKKGETSKFNREGVLVTYKKLRTAPEAARANKINEELYGPESLSIAARPFMGPAARENYAGAMALFSAMTK